MAGTYTQLHIHFVIVVNNHLCLIHKSWKSDLNKYISGIITNKGHKSIAVNGVADHLHIFVGLKPSESISDLVRDIKNNSTNFINQNRFVKGKFSWQPGYGAFSHSHSAVHTVFTYIKNQEEHHRKKTFREEYLDILKENEISYDERYLFDWIDLPSQ